MPNILEETNFILKKYSIKANKSLGQNFLVNQNVIDENLLKLEALEAVPAYQELEGYHGDGVLTQQEEDWKNRDISGGSFVPEKCK